MRLVGKRGALLIVTLWIITILAVLAVSIGRYLSLEVRLTKFSLMRARLSALTRGGVYLAMQRLDADVTEEGYDWLKDDWAWFPEGDPEDQSQWIIELEDGSVLSIRIEDEERRIAVNAITQEHDDKDRTYLALSKLLASPGLAARIGDYVDANTKPFVPGGLETDDFAEPPYRAKSAPVVVEEELFRIPGLQEMQAELQASISVASGISQLNINTVGLAVLEALGLSASNASRLIGCRQDGVIFDKADTILDTADRCMGGVVLSDEERTLLMNAFTIASNHFTVTVTGQLKADGPTTIIRALIARSPDGSKIVSWKEF